MKWIFILVAAICCYSLLNINQIQNDININQFLNEIRKEAIKKVAVNFSQTSNISIEYSFEKLLNVNKESYFISFNNEIIYKEQKLKKLIDDTLAIDYYLIQLYPCDIKEDYINYNKKLHLTNIIYQIPNYLNKSIHNQLCSYNRYNINAYELNYISKILKVSIMSII